MRWRRRSGRRGGRSSSMGRGVRSGAARWRSVQVKGAVARVRLPRTCLGRRCRSAPDQRSLALAHLAISPPSSPGRVLPHLAARIGRARRIRHRPEGRAYPPRAASRLLHTQRTLGSAPSHTHDACAISAPLHRCHCALRNATAAARDCL
jgi:hypothetical protein